MGNWCHRLATSGNVYVSLQETVVQLSRMGVGAGIGELVEGGVVRMGGDDGDSFDEYDSDGDAGTSQKCVMRSYLNTVCVCVAKAVDKSPTAVDFADITELAEEGEGEGEGKSSGGLGDRKDSENKEMLFQKGMAFAQAQLSGMLQRLSCV